MGWFLDWRHVVHVGCRCLRMWSEVKDTALLDTLLWDACPKAHVFAGEPKTFVSAFETGEESAGEDQLVAL